MRRSSRDLPPNEGSVGELEKVLTVKDCPLCGYKTHKEMLYISERKLAEHIKDFCIGRNDEDAEESDIGVETSDHDYGSIRDANIARNAMGPQDMAGLTRSGMSGGGLSGGAHIKHRLSRHFA